MAELSTTLWMIQLFFLISVAISEDDAFEEDMKNATYECSISIYGNSWKMLCESENVGKGSKFYISKLGGVLKPVIPVVFEELLNVSSTFKSELYRCDSFLRPIILTDPSVMKEYCKNFSEQSELLVNVLKESFVKSLIITRVLNLKQVMNMLRDLSGLNEVVISNCSLAELTETPFSPNNSISVLSLKRNNIKAIKNGTFRIFPALKTLDLSENSLTQVNKNSFDGLRTISSLDLSFNHIEIISNDTLSDMMYLKKFCLNGNNCKYINEYSLQKNELMQAIEMSNNDLKTLPPKIFHPLTDLTNISCSNCSLVELDEDIFEYSLKLEFIILSHNQIHSLPNKIFNNQKFLVHVNLGFNNIKEISPEVFQHHSYLRDLILTQNEIGSLNLGTFDGAPHIYWLDLSRNKLEILSDNHVKGFKDLEHFDLRQNKIKVVQLGITIKAYIRNLFLSNNLISKLDIRWKNLVYLETLDLDNNELTYLDLPPCIESVKQTITVSLRNNKISKLNLNSLISDEILVKANRNMSANCFFNGGAKNFVDLTHNPLTCDCHLYPFYKYIKGNFPRKYQLDIFLHKNNLTCADPQYLKNETIINLRDDVFSCPFSDSCPMPCTCGVRGKDNMTFVNCSGHNLQNAPRNIPDQTTVLYFNNNKLSSMKNFNSKMWANLVELHMDNNLLKHLDEWNHPESLRHLSVRGNKLKTLPSSLMHFISNQSDFTLYFGDNDKNCSCDSESLKLFLKDNQEFVGDTNSIVCKVTNNGTAALLPLVLVPDSELCPLNLEGLNYMQKTMLISLSLFFTLLILLLMTYYKYRQLILSFFYIHCDILFRLCYTEDEYDDDKIFDAFVAYSSSDRDILMVLLQELENHPPYFNLCIHERNWLPGRFICDNILSSVQSSKRTIILLSNSFITSPWFNLELRAAVSKMSKDKINRIIIVLTEKTVSLSSVDPEIRHVISKRTYLVWNERWFWEKLRYAMPRKKSVRREENDEIIFQPNRRSSDVPLILQPM